MAEYTTKIAIEVTVLHQFDPQTAVKTVQEALKAPCFTKISTIGSQTNFQLHSEPAKEFHPVKALIVVDVQNDFCKGGALAVPFANEVVPLINELAGKMQAEGCVIFYTKDWHPANHCSFKENGGLWPKHCVQDTPGSELHPELMLRGPVFYKATNPAEDCYSGFTALDRSPIMAYRVHEALANMGISEVVVVGLALDYCVKATAIEANRMGFKTSVYLPATRAVNNDPKAIQQVIFDMTFQGIRCEGEFPPRQP